MMLTGPQTHSEGCREGNVSVSCRKLKEVWLVVHHVASTLTQTETCTYCTVNKSRSSCIFSVPYFTYPQQILTRMFLCNNFFFRKWFSSTYGIVFCTLQKGTEKWIKCRSIFQQRYDKNMTCRVTAHFYSSIWIIIYCTRLKKRVCI